MKRLAALALLAVLPGLSWGGAPERRTAVIDFAVEVVNTDSAVAYRVFNPTSTITPASVTEQTRICWQNETSTNTARVYISTFSTVDESRYGWQIAGSGTTSTDNTRGGEGGCADWGPNVPIFVWGGDGTAAQTIRFRRDR